MARITRAVPGGYGVNPGYELDTLRGARIAVNALAAYENVGSVHLFRRLDELNTPKSPYPNGDQNILACPTCGSGEYLHNADEAPMSFCGQCGQAIDWTVEG